MALHIETTWIKSLTKVQIAVEQEQIGTSDEFNLDDDDLLRSVAELQMLRAEGEQHLLDSTFDEYLLEMETIFPITDLERSA